jgi:mono/diheme cytochrome c family protein
MQGDLRQYLHDSTSTEHKEGYQQRIAGALGTLNWLCRQYISFYELPSHKILSETNELRTAITLQDWGKARLLLSSLIDQMPLPLEGLQPEDSDKKGIQTGKEIYKGYCQACHNRPYLEQARPAYSLFKMVRQLSQKEFIARMIVGVHGTAEIALQNPLTNADISGMFVYLLRENSEK